MPREVNQRIENYADTNSLKRHGGGGTSKPLRRGCRSPWTEHSQLRTCCWETLQSHQGRSDSGSNQRRQVVNREHVFGPNTHWEETKLVIAGVTPHPPHPDAWHSHGVGAGLGAGVGGEAGVQQPKPKTRRPPSARLCSALHRTAATGAWGPREGAGHEGRLCLETVLRTLLGGGGGRAARCWWMEGRWSIFQEQPKPQPIRISPQDPVHVPKDTRYTTCQVRVEGVPGRRPRQARSRSTLASTAPNTLRPRESRGTAAGGKAVAEGRPARRGGRRGTHQLRRGS